MQKFFKSISRYCALSIVLLFPFFSTFSSAAPLKVGVYPCPPFIIGSMDNEWDGLSIELWEKIAQDMGVEFTVENHLSMIYSAPLKLGKSILVSLAFQSRQNVNCSLISHIHSTKLTLLSQ